jgi:D-3-phosphoglycerate dehydrogenase
MSKKVLITDYVWPNVEAEKTILAKAGVEVVISPDSSEATLSELARDVDGILTCFAKVTGEVIQIAERCVVIGRYGVGVDNIDVRMAASLGIHVTYVPDYCVPEVSDHVMGLLLGWNRRIVLFDRATKTTGWGAEGLDMRIMRLDSKTLGIVGFGRIGRAVATKAKAFGMKVLVADPFITTNEAQQSGARKTELPELLKKSHFVTLHAPLVAETAKLVGERELGLMRPDAFLINAARGGLIDEDALYEALKSGQIAGAGLDVLVDLNPRRDHPLISLKNTIITPHTAFFSQEAVLELQERAAREIVSVLQGKMPQNLVTPKDLDHARVPLV